jgi:hypothetical protein
MREEHRRRVLEARETFSQAKASQPAMAPTISQMMSASIFPQTEQWTISIIPNSSTVQGGGKRRAGKRLPYWAKESGPTVFEEPQVRCYALTIN